MRLRKVPYTPVGDAQRLSDIVCGLQAATSHGEIRCHRSSEETRGETRYSRTHGRGQAHDVGGTWRDNRYPGVSCDIPSHLYSFSFRPNPGWSRVFAEGREIHAYLRACVQEEGLDDRLRLNCALSEAEWSDDEARWFVRTTRGDFSAASLVIGLNSNDRPAVEPAAKRYLALRPFLDPAPFRIPSEHAALAARHGLDGRARLSAIA